VRPDKRDVELEAEMSFGCDMVCVATITVWCGEVHVGVVVA
jgi:hypothetical protein